MTDFLLDDGNVAGGFTRLSAIPGPATSQNRDRFEGEVVLGVDANNARTVLPGPDGAMMAVDVQLGQQAVPGVPRKLFQFAPFAGAVTYDVAADGQRFPVNDPGENIPNAPITVMLNWWASLEAN
jgi:hypothetical protein